MEQGESGVPEWIGWRESLSGASVVWVVLLLADGDEAGGSLGSFVSEVSQLGLDMGEGARGEGCMKLSAKADVQCDSKIFCT